MKFILQITTRDIPHSEALESHIRQKAEKLETFYPQSWCRVVIEVPHKHKHQGRAFNVRLDITVPGKELVVNREADRMCMSRCATLLTPPSASLKTTAVASAVKSRRMRQCCAAK